MRSINFELHTNRAKLVKSLAYTQCTTQVLPYMI